MKNLKIINYTFSIIIIAFIYPADNWYDNLHKMHIGIEYNLFWGDVDNDLILASYENWGADDLSLERINYGYSRNIRFNCNFKSR